MNAELVAITFSPALKVHDPAATLSLNDMNKYHHMQTNSTTKANFLPLSPDEVYNPSLLITAL